MASSSIFQCIYHHELICILKASHFIKFSVFWLGLSNFPDFSEFNTPCVTGQCNSFGNVCVSVCASLSWRKEQTYRLKFWHGGQVEGYLGHVSMSRSPNQKTFTGISMRFLNRCLTDVKEAIQRVLPISTSLTRVHAYSKLWVYDKYWLFTNQYTFLLTEQLHHKKDIFI